MGLTLTTLHIPGGADAVLPLMKKDHSIRTHSPGWTTLLSDAPDSGQQTLRTLARRVPGVCLYFHYSDDDMFLLEMYEGGKRTAVLSTCELLGKSSRVERISPAVFGDERATPALKLIGKCALLEEQLALAEEALGLSLLEHPEFEPRTVRQGTETFDAVSARMSLLKKRRNLYRAVALEEADVPEGLRRISPSGYQHSPCHRTVALPAQDAAGRPLTGEAEVDLRHSLLEDPCEGYLGVAFVDRKPSAAIRLEKDGSVRWVFAPKDVTSLHLSPRSRPGTLLAADYGVRQNARVWELSREDGRILHEGVLTHGCRGDARWLEPLQRYASFWLTKEERGFSLLDAELTERETRTFLHSRVIFDQPAAVDGCTFWAQDPFTYEVIAFDVAQGMLTQITLEDRAYLTGLGAHGLLTATKTGKELLLFDREGRLVSKHPFKGWASLRNIPVIDGQMYIVEELGNIGFIRTDEPPQKRFWRIEQQ